MDHEKRVGPDDSNGRRENMHTASTKEKRSQTCFLYFRWQPEADIISLEKLIGWWCSGFTATAQRPNDFLDGFINHPGHGCRKPYTLIQKLLPGATVGPAQEVALTAVLVASCGFMMAGGTEGIDGEVKAARGMNSFY